MSSLPKLMWLRSFETAARLGSFTAAAEDLGLTQAGIRLAGKLNQIFDPDS